MAVLFRFSHEEYVTFLPKSITTAIGMGVSEKLGGYVSISVAAIIITGVLGNIFAEIVFRLFRIHEPVAKGIALGTASHAIGTAKAMELGEVEGAMSSLSIVVAGLITVIGQRFFTYHVRWLMQEETREYQKVISYLSQMIASGELAIGSRLPTERSLAETLSIGRNSTREALRMLDILV